MKKRIVLPSVLALAILATILTSRGVSAQDLENYPTIVQKIADQFDPDVNDGEEVFDDERDERRAEAFARFADRLDDLVLEGKITRVQRDEILDRSFFKTS